VRTDEIDATPLRSGARGSSRELASTLCLVLAGALVWVFAFLFLFSGFSERHAQHVLYGQIREELAAGTAPTGAPIDPGAPIGVIDAPALDLHHVVVVEGTAPADLQRGPGHLTGSVLPGQAGVAVLMGRARSFGAPFRDVASLTAGTAIDVTTGEGTFHYVVADVRRAGDPVPAALPAGGSRLTLVTSSGGGLTPSRTVYADATLQGKAQPAGAVGPQDPAGKAMARDHSTLTLALLALSLQLLAVALAATVWAQHRWTRIAAWVTGAPVVLAALWITSMVASRLLPNLV
jgi:sortase A